MLLRTKSLCFIILVLVISNSYGSENNILQDCRERMYAQLIQKDQIFRALAMKISDTYPQECIIEYQNIQRFTAIEGNEYFQETLKDSDYRTLTEASLRDINSQQLPYSMYTNLSVDGPNPKMESQNQSQIEFVEGYGILQGTK